MPVDHPIRKASWALLVAGGMGLALWAAFQPRAIEVEAVPVVRGAFEQNLEDDGRARVRERLAVTLPWSGEVERLTIREGQWIEAGGVLAWVRPAPPGLQDVRTQAELQARGAAAQAAWQLAQRQSEVAQVAWQRAALAGARALALFEEGFVSRAQVDAAALDLQREERSWQAAQAAERMALHQLEQVRWLAEPYASPGAGSRRALRARERAQVLRVVQPHAAVLPAGATLMEIGDVTRPEVVVPLLSQDALRLQPGMRAWLSGWSAATAAEQTMVEGRVRLIEPAAATKVSALGLEEQRVLVVIDPLHDLPPGDGYTVRVRLELQREPQALLVPSAAVFPWPGSPDRHGVFRFEGGRAHLTAVTLRGQGSGQAWVVEGLTEGQAVITYPPAALTDGARVKTPEPGGRSMRVSGPR